MPGVDRAKILSTAVGFVESHFALDNKKIAGYLAEGAMHGGGPESIKMPLRNNEEYLKFNDAHFPNFTKYSGEITESYVDVEKRTAILYTHSTAEMAGHTYDNTYIIKVQVSADGERIDGSDVFIDSHTMIEFQKQMQDFRENVWDKK